MGVSPAVRILPSRYRYRIRLMKCPRCETVLSSINAVKIDAVESPEHKHPARAYVCPHCDTILGVVADPDQVGWVPDQSSAE